MRRALFALSHVNNPINKTPTGCHSAPPFKSLTGYVPLQGDSRSQALLLVLCEDSGTGLINGHLGSSRGSGYFPHSRQLSCTPDFCQKPTLGFSRAIFGPE